MMRKHAKLSASSSHRWVKCTGSVEAEEGIPPIPNKYADEGIEAHNIASKLLNNPASFKNLDCSPWGDMFGYVIDYITYVNKLSQSNTDGSLMSVSVEERVNYYNIAPGQFGTADAILFDSNSKMLHIIDFKYGINKVQAFENTQLLLYAIGKCTQKEYIYVSGVTLHIVQPRIKNYDKWEVSLDELDKWKLYLAEKATAALAPNAPRTPHEDACRYCRANPTCPALNAKLLETIEIANKGVISDEETKFVLDNSKLLTNFLKKVEESVYNKLSTGISLPGYKLVQGRNMRKINPSKKEALFELLGEKAYNKSLIGIGQLEKLVDKETFNNLVYTSISSPILTKEDDKRPTIEMDELKFDPI